MSSLPSLPSLQPAVPDPASGDTRDASRRDDLLFLAQWERAPSASLAALLRVRQLRRARNAADDGR